jgi:hypothetical protein
MTTEAKIAANRANAQRSTGPNSPEGKERSSHNARKRRLPGDTPLTLAEDEAAFAAHHESLCAALMPQDAFEAELVRQIALDQWRIGRVQRVEAALFDAETHRVDYSRSIHPHPSELRHGRARPADIWPDKIGELSRREAALERALARSMALLERRQAARRRGDVPSSEQKNFPDEASFSREINGAG